MGLVGYVPTRLEDGGLAKKHLQSYRPNIIIKSRYEDSD